MNYYMIIPNFCNQNQSIFWNLKNYENCKNKQFYFWGNSQKTFFLHVASSNLRWCEGWSLGIYIIYPEIIRTTKLAIIASCWYSNISWNSRPPRMRPLSPEATPSPQRPPLLPRSHTLTGGQSLRTLFFIALVFHSRYERPAPFEATFLVQIEWPHKRRHYCIQLQICVLQSCVTRLKPHTWALIWHDLTVVITPQ